MEWFFGVLGLLTTGLLQVTYWNIFQESTTPSSSSAHPSSRELSLAPFTLALLSSLTWSLYALPSVTPHRLLFLLAHSLQSLSLTALLLAALGASSADAKTKQVRPVAQILIPGAALIASALVGGTLLAPFPAVFAWTAAAASVVLTSPLPLMKLFNSLDTGASPSRLLSSWILLTHAVVWAAFGFASDDHWMALPYALMAGCEALFIAATTAIGGLDGAIPSRSEVEGYELVETRHFQSGDLAAEQSLEDTPDDFDEWLQMDILHGRRMA